MSRFGPSRAELKMRVVISIVGLAFLIGAYAMHGITGIVSLELGIIGLAFFGGTGFAAIRALIRETRK